MKNTADLNQAIVLGLSISTIKESIAVRVQKISAVEPYIVDMKVKRTKQQWIDLYGEVQVKYNKLPVKVAKQYTDKQLAAIAIDNAYIYGNVPNIKYIKIAEITEADAMRSYGTLVAERRIVELPFTQAEVQKMEAVIELRKSDRDNLAFLTLV